MNLYFAIFLKNIVRKNYQIFFLKKYFAENFFFQKIRIQEYTFFKILFLQKNMFLEKKFARTKFAKKE